MKEQKAQCQKDNKNTTQSISKGKQIDFKAWSCKYIRFPAEINRNGKISTLVFLFKHTEDDYASILMNEVSFSQQNAYSLTEETIRVSIYITFKMLSVGMITSRTVYALVMWIVDTVFESQHLL